MGWHVPELFTMAMHSEAWHSVEQASFLVAGFLFWWPVVQAVAQCLDGAAMVDPFVPLSRHVLPM